MSNQQGFGINPLVLDESAIVLANTYFEMQAAVDRLRQTLELICAGEPPWGTDEPGRKFGDKYTTVVAKAVPALTSYCEQLKHAATSISQGSAGYQQQDLEAAKAIKGAVVVKP